MMFTKDQVDEFARLALRKGMLVQQGEVMGANRGRVLQLVERRRTSKGCTVYYHGRIEIDAEGMYETMRLKGRSREKTFDNFTAALLALDEWIK